MQYQSKLIQNQEQLAVNNQKEIYYQELESKIEQLRQYQEDTSD